MSSEPTPLMKQYGELKEQAGDALLFFRMGDFYELFGDDAVEAARLLEITLTSRDKNKPDPLPMAGVPHHSAQGYIQKLLRSGKKVAIAEQFEEAVAGKPGKTIVRRAIVRTLTPAIQFDSETPEANYLATALAEDASDPAGAWALACLDVSTGDFRYAQFLKRDELLAQAPELPIRHWLELSGAPLQELKPLCDPQALFEPISSNTLGQEAAEDKLKRHFGVGSLEAFCPEGVTRRALGLLLVYALRTQGSPTPGADPSNGGERTEGSLAHLRLPEPLRRARSLILGPRTAQHLDFFPDLFSLINRTRSALGARTLRRVLIEPLRDPSEIAHRQAGVRELADKPARAEGISQRLAELYDLERIAGRLTAGLANPRDTLALGRSLGILPELARALDSAGSELLTELRSRIARAAESLGALSARILSTQSDEAPLVAREGGIFKKGTDAELDRLIDLSTEGSRFLVELETRERERTGIPSLKVRYNRVFGYYIEVTQAHLKNVPADYQRKQTTVGAERFFTEELKKFEDEIVTAEEKRKRLEQRLFNELLDEARSHTARIMEAARALGELDAWVSFSRLTELPGWNFPSVDASMDIEISAGRHPVVDSVSRGKFVPNDLRLGPTSRLSLLITGPNMGGKSTVMRQVALIVILGQCGAPVPARAARWGAFSSVYTRIGAHDAIARGQSTFMVEMSELAHILHRADERSLVVLDEIGRGTSTYDGISVAWSTLEWICRKIRCRTLFATHYHELTRLHEALPGLGNAHMAVAGGASGKEAQLRFLYQLKEGPANESFGIQVAQLAGIPKGVIQRAWEVLGELERSSGAGASAGDEPSQLSLGSGPGEALDDVLPLFAASTGRKGLTRGADDGARVNSVTRSGLGATHSRLEQAFGSELGGLEGVPAPPLQLELPAWVEELKKAEVNGMTPLQALNFLAELQGKARA